MLALLSYWVFLDAEERGSNASLLWAIGCLVFQPLSLGYLLYRSEIGGRTEPAGVTERAVGTFVISHILVVQLRFSLSHIGVYPPVAGDFIAELQYYILLFIVGVIPGYWLVWQRGWVRIRRLFGWVHESETAAP